MDRNPRSNRPLAPSSSSQAGAPGPTRNAPLLSKRKRTETKVACNNCRAKKSACDGNRPSCGKCVLDLKECVYISKDKEETVGQANKRHFEEAHRKRRHYEEIIDRLRSGPELEAFAALRKLRSDASAAELPSQNVHKPSDLSLTSIANTTSHGEPGSSVSSALGGVGASWSQAYHTQQAEGSTGNDRPFQTTNELLKRDKSASLELLELIVKADTELSQELLRQLRMKYSPSSILQSVKGYETNTIRLSQHKIARSITPPIQSPQELQLMVRYPTTYPRLDPIDLKATKALLSSTFPSHVNLEQIELDHSANTPFFSSQPNTGSDLLPNAPSTIGNTAARPSTGLGPSKPPTLLDSRLIGLDIKFWTTVPIKSTLAAEIVSAYLEFEHPVCGLFDGTAFVTGLVQNDIDVCNAFQVNCLLAFASQGYSAESSLAATYSYQFAEEAGRLWRGERGTDCPANVVGLYLLFQYFAKCWKEEPARLFYQHLCEMVKRMRLFGVTNPISLEDLASAPDAVRNATAYAAWGIFNGITLQSVYRWGETPEYPPILPIPGDKLSTNNRETIQRPEVPLPPYMGQTFPAFCRFWSIVIEILVVYHGEHGQRNVPLAFALSKYQKLLALAEQLPIWMARTEKVKGHVLIFHIWLHVLILDVFRPFIADSKQHDLESWTPSSSTPEAIFSASVKQLKHLIHFYVATHTSTYHTIYWHVALISVANAVIKSTSDPERHVYLLLCLYQYGKLNVCYSVAGTISQGLLAMAVENGAVQSKHAALYINMFNLNNCRKVGQKLQSGFVVDLDLARTDKESALADALADKFDRLTVFSDFTKGVV